MRRRRIEAVGVVLAAGIVAMMVRPASGAVVVTCGEIVRASIRLANDLTDCPSNGLVVGAADITIDLGGREIDGDGIFDNSPFRESGVDNARGFDGVRIVNGSLTGFDSGVFLRNASRNVVTRLTLSNNRDGVVLDGTDSTKVRRNVFSLQVTNGIRLSESPSNVVSKNRIFDSQQSGVLLLGEQSDRNKIRRNEIIDQALAGITIGAGADESSIVGNEITGGSRGIGLDDAKRSRVTDNVVRGAGEGIFSFLGEDNTYDGNRTNDNGRIGILLRGEAGSTVSNNTANRNGPDDPNGFGIAVGSPGTTVDGNHCTGNGNPEQSFPAGLCER